MVLELLDGVRRESRVAPVGGLAAQVQVPGELEVLEVHVVALYGHLKNIDHLLLMIRQCHC